MEPVGRMLAMRASGTALCLASATAFGAMAIFGKLAYDGGANVATLLASRFGLAAILFWAVVLLRGALREIRALPKRDVRLAVGLGAVGYAAQATCYFLALERMDASLLSLILYTFPAMVAVAAVLLGRERIEPRRIAALVLASTGLVLVLAGAGTGSIDPLGALLGLGGAVIYTGYILSSERIATRTTPDVLSAIVCTGAAIPLALGAAAIGQLRPGEVSAAGWGWLACLAAVSTFIAIGLFFAGLKRVGPTTAAILSTVEPPVTVVLAFAIFSETLGPVQLLGGLLVLSAVPVLNMRRRRRTVEPVPAPVPVPLAAAAEGAA